MNFFQKLKWLKKQIRWNYKYKKGTWDYMGGENLRYEAIVNQIKKYVKGEGNYLVMNNNASIPVSRSQKDKLIEKFGWL